LARGQLLDRCAKPRAEIVGLPLRKTRIQEREDALVSSAQPLSISARISAAVVSITFEAMASPVGRSAQRWGTPASSRSI
jgi:hypothetical protein